MKVTRFVLIVGLPVGLLVAAGACQAAPMEWGLIGPLRVEANKTSLSGVECPVEVEFTATLDFPKPHPRDFMIICHWERSDGVRTEDQRVRVEPGQGPMVFHDTWEIGRPGGRYKIRNALIVDSGKNHLGEASPIVTITCK